MSETFGIRELKPYQKEALVQFLQKKKSPNWMCQVAYLSSFTVCFQLNFWNCWPCCCCGFVAWKLYQRPGPQAGKSWNSYRLYYRVCTVLKSPWILGEVLEKSLNFCASPWKVLKFLCKSLKSPWIFFNFECSRLERFFGCFLVVQNHSSENLKVILHKVLYVLCNN